MRVVSGILAGLFLLLSLGAAGAKEPKTLQELDVLLAATFKEGSVPGASVAVVENGQIVFAKGYGVSDLAAKIPVTPETVFRAGSISKSITAIAIMQMVEQGKLSLDARLADLAPEVKFENPYEKTDPVRLVHLIEHTTGWPDITLRILQQDGKGWSTLRGVEDASPDFISRWKPGYFPVYNNAGPAVAGFILEKASGQKFGAYVNDHVLRPMGMASGDFDLTPALAAHLSKSYTSDGTPVPYQYISLPPAGSLATDVRDLAQLVRFFLGRGTVDGRQILKPESVERIERTESTLGARYGFTNGYGLGNAPFPGDGSVTYRGHNGGIDAFTSVYGYTTRNNSGYVLMANGGEGVDIGSQAALLIQNYLTRGLPRAKPSGATVSDAALENYAGVYRNITPPNTLVRPFSEILGLSMVSADHGKLVVGGNDWFPVAAHVFRRGDRDQPGLGFLEHEGTVYKFSPFYAAEKEPLWRVVFIGAVFLLLGLGTAIGLIMVVPWIVAWFRGRLAERGGLLMRLAPLLSVVTLVATFALVLAAVASSGTSAFQTLGNVDVYSLIILLCSVAFPLLAVAGLVLSVIKKDARLFVRLYAGLTSAALVVCAVYTAMIGWLPAMTWTM